jgi:hypothetical protein
MLALTETQKEEIKRLHYAQQANLIETYAAALGKKDINQIRALFNSQAEIAILQKDYLFEGRLSRAIIAGILLGAFLYICFRKRSQEMLPILAGSIVFLIVFHLLYSVIPGLPYSFSIITSPESFILDAIVKTFISYLLAAVTAGIIIRIRHEPPPSLLTLNLKFTALMMLVAGAPSFWYLVLYGVTIKTVLPDIGLLFRGMLSLVQVMTVGLSGLILTGLSAIITALVGHFRH